MPTFNLHSSADRRRDVGRRFRLLRRAVFPGKLTYARRFPKPIDGVAGVQIITASRGLLSADARVCGRDLREFASVAVDANEPRFTQPLLRSAEILAAASCEVVLLGSVATGKYVDPLLPVLGSRLLFPSQIVGRGDMSRGGLLLRSAERNEELDYISLSGAIRHGRRAMVGCEAKAQRRLSSKYPYTDAKRVSMVTRDGRGSWPIASAYWPRYKQRGLGSLSNLVSTGIRKGATAEAKTVEIHGSLDGKEMAHDRF